MPSGRQPAVVTSKMALATNYVSIGRVDDARSLPLETRSLARAVRETHRRTRDTDRAVAELETAG